ncbi:MAG: hypothetical protein LBV42_03350 [Methanobrevibacter sp.]|jgi:hypothetical protein|nr:hypothetical protein [Methanobrevibacter sp.]
MNGTFGAIFSLMYVAKSGAIAEPIKQMKLYVADVVDLSLSPIFIIAVVNEVLMFPIKIPERIILTTSVSMLLVKIPMINKIATSKDKKN